MYKTQLKRVTNLDKDKNMCKEVSPSTNRLEMGLQILE